MTTILLASIVVLVLFVLGLLLQVRDELKRIEQKQISPEAFAAALEQSAQSVVSRPARRSHFG